MRLQATLVMDTALVMPSCRAALATCLRYANPMDTPSSMFQLSRAAAHVHPCMFDIPQTVCRRAPPREQAWCLVPAARPCIPARRHRRPLSRNPASMNVACPVGRVSWNHPVHENAQASAGAASRSESASVKEGSSISPRMRQCTARRTHLCRARVPLAVKMELATAPGWARLSGPHFFVDLYIQAPLEDLTGIGFRLFYVLLAVIGFGYPHLPLAVTTLGFLQEPYL